MKKIALLLMCVVISCSAFAQDKKFTFGPKVAVSLSNVWGVSGHDAIIGYKAGLFAEYRATSLIAIAPELMFSAQGTKWKEDGDKATNHINYITLPIMAKFYVSKGLSVDFGPELGYAMFNHLDGTKIDSDLYKKFNFGLGLGLSYNVSRFVIDARYNLGLTKIYKTSADFESKAKNYDIEVGVGYRF